MVENVLIAKYNGEEISITTERRVDKHYPYYERVECKCGGAIWFDVTHKRFSKNKKCIKCGSLLAIKFLPISLSLG